jgi:L-threonylcarbamoyladenylate synthase
VSFDAVWGATVLAAESATDADMVHHAADALRAGAVVAIPTDTVYGLAAAIDRPDAISRLYTIKGRPAEKAIPVLIADIEGVHRVTPHFSAKAAQLARSFWPGALTLVLPARPDLPRGVTTVNGDGMQTVAVRMPDNMLARDIIAAAGGALAVTSANRSGAAPAVEACEVNQLQLAPPLLIVDGGRAPGGVPSTIVAVTAGATEVLREGAIPAPAIAAALAETDPVASADVRARYDQRMMQEHERSDERNSAS